MFLLHTNVISELRKAGDGKADTNVTSWLSRTDASNAFLDKAPVPAPPLSSRRTDVAQQPVHCRPTRWRRLSKHRPMAAAGPLLPRSGHPGPHRLQDHIPGQREQLRVPID
jgi:hypothetical protein